MSIRPIVVVISTSCRS